MHMGPDLALKKVWPAGCHGFGQLHLRRPATDYLLPTTYYLLLNTYHMLQALLHQGALATYYLLPTTYCSPQATYYRHTLACGALLGCLAVAMFRVGAGVPFAKLAAQVVSSE